MEAKTGKPVKLPSYDQVRREIHRLKSEPELVAMCEGAEMKAINRKTPHLGYHASAGNRLSFQERWYVCSGLLSRLQGREFDVYYDRRDVGVLYLIVEGEYAGEAYCPSLTGGRVSEWEARAMRKHDEMQAILAREQGREVRARIQDEAGSHRKRRAAQIRQVASGCISALVDVIIRAVILKKGEQQHLKSPVRLTKHYTV